MKPYGAVLAVLVLAACSNLQAPPASSAKADSAAPETSNLTVAFNQPEVVVSPCPPDMVDVEGSYCSNLETKCLHWLDPNNPGVNGPAQCAQFATPSVCKGPVVKKHFCIDRYEWPNKQGTIPQVYLSWNGVKESCEALGKRLCTESEWTLACEGPERKPYPYGYERDSAACNIDRTWIDPVSYRTDPRDKKKYQYPTPMSRLDQRVASGTRPGCVSDYGVYDMTGNVDEWVVNEGGRPFKSGLKGGHWAIGARNRCRPMTDAHNETFTFYETSGRCCSNPR